MLTNMLLPTRTSGFWDQNLSETNFFTDSYSTSFSNMLRNSDSSTSSSDEPCTSGAKMAVVGRLQLPCQPKQKLCEVCGNIGATSHYGGTVCGGCKIFFSRTVQSRKGFVCEREGACPMNAGKRAKCRACRFQLCLRAHMSPEEVGRLRDMRQGEFAPVVKKEGSVVGYFDESSQPSTSLANCTSQVTSFLDLKYGGSETSILNCLVNLENSYENNRAMRHADLFPRHCNASIDISNAIFFPMPICEKIPMDYMRRIILKDPKTNFKLFWCRNVLLFLEWAGALEDLMEFPVQEKTLLLAENFVSVTCLTSFYGFLRIQREEFEKGNDDVPPPCAPEWFSEITQLSTEASLSIQKSISEIMEPMDSLDITIEELVLLKFIMLFNEPSSRSSSDTYRIRCYRMKYCELLRKYISEQIADQEKRMARIQELLKIVDSVRNTAMYLDNWMTIFYTSNTCQMNDVLVYDFHVRTWNDVTVPSGPNGGIQVKKEH